ncbi:MAG TPA: enoyl-CoA hydratase-related protein [Fimbriimonadaceae bacterium]|nr:enoyl-CoA hydratase-related protein [Fimbriimonadaceae bacterium]
MLNVTPGPVTRIVLNRPEVRNAFNDELIAMLANAFANLEKGTRAVVVSGEGEAFCAGGDLEWMRKASGYTQDENRRDALRLARLFRAIVDCPAVVIAKVAGPAFGGGCGLVAAADIAIASTDAKFAFSEVRLGLIPATISGFVIPKIGVGHARALFTTGEAFGAEHAFRIGLIHEVVAREELDKAVERKLKLVFSAGPEAIRQSKRLIQDYPLTLDEAARRLADARAGKEGQEGVAAFLEKRKASFVADVS